MRPSVGFTARLKRAALWMAYNAGEDVEQGKLGDLAAQAIGRAEPFGQTTVSAWFRVGVRDADTIWAIAEACGVRAAWLAFGEEPMVAVAAAPLTPGVGPLPAGWEDVPVVLPPDRAERLTDEVIARYQEEERQRLAREAERAARQAPPPGRKRRRA